MTVVASGLPLLKYDSRIVLTFSRKDSSFSNSTAYVSSKYALKGFADSLRTELRDYNVKVSSIYPGAIDSEFWDAINVDFARHEMLSIDDLSETILHVIEAPNSSVIEDVVVRRTAGDF